MSSLSLSPLLSEMSLSTSPNTPPSSPPTAPLETMHPRVVKFFQEQAELARQPAPPLTLRFPKKVYEIADEGCVARINSPDWRKRNISAISTEVAFDLFAKELREPLLEATQEALEQLNPQTQLILQFPETLVQESDREQFVQVDGTNSFILASSYEKLSQLSQKFYQFAGKTPQERPGAVFGKDLLKRMENIMKHFFQPEWHFFEHFSLSGKAPMVTILGKNPHPVDPGTIFINATCEVAKRIKASGFPLELTGSLIEETCQQDPEEMKTTIDFLTAGGTLKNISNIGW